MRRRAEANRLSLLRSAFALHDRIYEQKWRSYDYNLIPDAAWDVGFESVKELIRLVERLGGHPQNALNLYREAEKDREAGHSAHQIQMTLDSALSRCHSFLREWAIEIEVYGRLEREFRYAGRLLRRAARAISRRS